MIEHGVIAFFRNVISYSRYDPVVVRIATFVTHSLPVGERRINMNFISCLIFFIILSLNGDDYAMLL